MQCMLDGAWLDAVVRLRAAREPAVLVTLATVHVHQVSVLPESVIVELPAGSHVLIMTHDHAEDVAVCDAALRRADLGSIGLIGSSGKWANFRRRLAQEGGHDEDTIARIRTPIGLPDIGGKEPATIAVSVAADLLRTFERESEAVRS